MTSAVRAGGAPPLLALAGLGTALPAGFAARAPGWTGADADLGGVVLAHRAPWATAVARVLDAGFGAATGLVLVAALVLALAATRRMRAAWRSLAVVVAGWGPVPLVRAAVARPRPPAAHALVLEQGPHGYPSSHVCLTLSLVIACALLAGSAVPLVLRADRLGALALRLDNRRRSWRAGPPDARRVTILLLHAYGMGGTIRTAFNLAAVLAGDHDVEIVSVTRTRDRPFFPIPPGVRVSFLTGRRAPWPARWRSRLIPRQETAYDKFDLRTDVALARFLRGLRGGVLITTRPGLNLAAALLAPPGVIVIGQEHVGFGTHKPAVRRLIARRYGRLDALVTLTRADLHAYRAALGPGAPRHLLRIPNAVPPVRGGPSPLTGKVVLAIGRLSKVKGFDLLLAAWEQVAAAHPGWTLRIAGSGPDRGRLLDLAEERRLTGSVRFLGAVRDVGAQLDEAAVLAVSSRHEGFPMVILEAMAKGVPVVSFDCPSGPGEIITHGWDGLLVPPGDVDALATQLCVLIADEALRRRMGDRALRTSGRYDAAHVGAEWRRLLTELGGPR
ncbi:glycosyltransferase family 4 protein [Actinomadura sp. ATCC 31491]|uniref:Glycosyltransferase family 4 protein n=1 Tax=Actinomadura luzonensis TaxID=2805427 RepID=A0ABT0FUY2_9ACTN|nr:glycosyltransferase family 4 protein [Actinomadura luzonensis]MCK2215790.1 glycosyltransferase family 4 protein [Actinomadura luzonensis]